jgi:FAD/FMN-containing dehydrogenase
MSSLSKDITLVRAGSTTDVARVIIALGDHGIPSAMYGVCAATHYNGGLCPLVSPFDTELHKVTHF